MVHVYATQDHTYKPDNLKTAYKEKNAKYKLYSTGGLAFAGCVMNSFGQLGPDILRIGWKCASKAARSDVPSQPLGVGGAPGGQGEETPAFKARRGYHYYCFCQRILEVVYEGVAERLYGRSYALRNNPVFLQWLMHSKPEWTPMFNDPPPSPPPPCSLIASPPSSIVPAPPPSVGSQGGVGSAMNQAVDVSAQAAHFLTGLAVLRATDSNSG